MSPQYAWVLEVQMHGEWWLTAVFTWPNCAKKYLRDIYTIDGELHLPPEDRLRLRQVKVNPKSGRAPVGEPLNVEKFLAA